MSSYKCKARHKDSGIIYDVWCLDNHYGQHKYGYIVVTRKDLPEYDEQQFFAQYEVVENGKEKEA